MREGKFIWLDGELVPWEQATTHIMSHGLLYGAGAFEGIRSYSTDRGPVVFRLADHLRRLAQSAKVYLATLPCSLDELADAVKAVVRENGVDNAYVRPLVWLGLGDDPIAAPLHVAVASWPWTPHLGEASLAEGVTVRVSSYRRIDPNVIPPAAKATGQYLNSFLARIEAITSGCDEAILLNAAGHVTDGSAENVFVVVDGELVTPPTVSGALAGITRSSAMDIAADLGIPVREADLVRTDLYLGDEVFLTGTASDLVPVRSVDSRVVGETVPGPVTAAIRERFEAIVRGRVPEFSHWLEPVLA